jgi:acyl-CoA synthetase (AMP-forming)/AMP-acid ligase II
MRTILDFIKESSEVNPNNPAITLGDESITYKELDEGIYNVAANAIHNGAKVGDRFLYAAKPTPESMIVALGLIKAGLVLVFADPFTSPELFASRVELTQARYTLANPLLYMIGRKALTPLRMLKKLTICDFASATKENFYLGSWMPGVPLGAKKVDTWITNPPKDEVTLPTLTGEEDVVIVFTSGTTSDPKGVVHTLSTLSANVNSFATKFGIKQGDIVYSEPMTLGITALSKGAEWQIPVKGEVLPNCDVYFAVPTEVLEMLDLLEKTPKTFRPKVKVLGTGAAPVLPSLVSRIYNILGEETTVYGVYGMTEILPIAVVDGKEKLNYDDGDLVGELIGNTQVKIAEDNEVMVSGSGLMRSYLGKEETKWHATGDLGKIVNGQLVLLGRKKDMFIRGNMNIYPGLYEPSLSKIEGVKEAVLVGVEDHYGNDYIVLAVSPIDETIKHADLQKRVKREMSKHMDSDAVPDRVMVFKKIPTSGRALKRDYLTLKTFVIDALDLEMIGI